jgi:hypothetical protein
MKESRIGLASSEAHIEGDAGLLLCNGLGSSVDSATAGTCTRSGSRCELA